MLVLTYLFDPLCGWCYGGLPMLRAVRQDGDLEIDLLPTGLFADEGAFAMNQAFADHAWSADQKIAALSGQPFSELYRRNVLGDPMGRVDSGPATLALTAVQMTDPDRELDALDAIQAARYVHGRNIGDPAVVADILRGLTLSSAAAHFEAADEALLAANRRRIARGRAALRDVGARGVPCLIARSDAVQHALDPGLLYGGLEALRSAIGGFDASASGRRKDA